MKRKRLQFILLMCGAIAFTSCKKASELTDGFGSRNLLAMSNPASLSNLSMNNWMKAIPDQTNITELSIPGTHNSAAKIDPTALGATIENVSKCQDLTITDQLETGVRFLDIRCRLDESDNLTIHHGIVYQELNFNDVLMSCYRFLENNPSETIIMSVKEEYSKKAVSFENKFGSAINQDLNRWDLSPELSSLGSMRGKIKLLRRFTATTVKGIDATKWDDNGTFSVGNNIKIQDEYKRHIGSEKWTSVKNMLDEAKAKPDNKLLYINYASATKDVDAIVKDFTSTNPLSMVTKFLNFKGTSKIVANHVNYQIKSSFTGATGRYGIIPVDFIDRDLSAKIVMTNPALKSLNVKLPAYKDGWNYDWSYPLADNDNRCYDIFLPANRGTNKTKLFVFIHGGNFTTGDKNNGEYQNVVNAINKEFPDCAIANINYEASVQTRIDKQISDVANALKELRLKSNELNISSDDIILVGESAGAYLAFYEGLKNNAGEGNKPKYKAIVSLSGFANMLPEMANNTLNFAATAGIALKLDLSLGLKDVGKWFNVDNPLYNAASKKWSPVQWIPEMTKMTELYLFYGEDDHIIETSESEKIKTAVLNRFPSYKKGSIASFKGQNHTMDKNTKEDIAKILRQVITF